MRLVGDDGTGVPCDGVAQGELLVRGHWVVSAYFDDAAASQSAFTPEGWFRTGDIASLDADGYLTMRDRSKDVIKSGGEWISSLDLENIAAGHPDVAEAAAIGVAHPTWGERPVLVVVKKPGTAPSVESLLTFLDGKIATWWVPDDVLFLTSCRTRRPAKFQSACCENVWATIACWSAMALAPCRRELSRLRSRGRSASR